MVSSIHFSLQNLRPVSWLCHWFLLAPMQVLFGDANADIFSICSFSHNVVLCLYVCKLTYLVSTEEHNHHGSCCTPDSLAVAMLWAWRLAANCGLRCTLRLGNKFNCDLWHVKLEYCHPIVFFSWSYYCSLVGICFRVSSQLNIHDTHTLKVVLKGSDHQHHWHSLTSDIW